MVEHADRPYVIIHVCASLDGRISGAFMGAPAAAPALTAYRELQAGFKADALLYGATTARAFAGGGSCAPDATVLAAESSAPATDHIAQRDAASYLVDIDPAGEAAWPQGTFERPGRPAAHVIEVVTEATPAAFLANLRARGVSYIVAGSAEVDLALALRKLAEHWGIERVLACGGGVVDWALLAAGVVDEVSIVVAPVVDGARDVATSFDQSPFAQGAPVGLILDAAERLDGGALHVRYRA